MATSTIFNFNFNNSEIVDSTGQWYNATTGTPTTEFIEHDGNTALLQRAYVAGTAYTRDINPVFFQSRDPTFTAHTYTIELQLYPLKDPGGANFGPESGPVLDFNPDADDEEGRVRLNTSQGANKSNTFYWQEYNLSGEGIPFLTVAAADGTYNRWYSIRIERVDDGTNTGATIKIYVDGTLVANETITYPQDARKGCIGNSIRYTYRRSSIDPQGAGAAIDNFKLTAGIAPSSVVDVSLANLQRNNANLLSFIKGKVPTVNDATLTIQQNGVNVQTFTANASTNATANIQCVDLTNNQTVGGNKEFIGTTTAHDLVPSATDTYNFGSSSVQWNNAYIKSLTINGVACGDILTHNVSEFVNVTGAQTIGGVKTFSASPRVTKTSPDIALNISDCDVTELPTEAKFASLYFRDKNNKNLAYIAGQQRTDGAKRLCLRTHRTDNINNYYAVDLDSDGNFYPEQNDSLGLGTPVLKWKSIYTNAINGINPGALSMPDLDNGIDISGYITVVNNANKESLYTPPANGWISVALTRTGGTSMAVMLKQDNFASSGHNIAQENGTTTCSAMLPVKGGVQVSINSALANGIAFAYFYPCQGNV